MTKHLKWLSEAIGYPDLPLLTPSRSALHRMKMFVKLLQPGDGSNRLMRPPRGWKPSSNRTTASELWQQENARLEVRLNRDVLAQDNDSDDAMFELVRRDPRYLATPLVLARLLWWRMQVQHSKYEGRTPSRKKALDAHIKRTGRVGTKATRAAEKIADLARSIAAATGRGQQQYRSEYEVRAAVRAYRQRVRNAALLVKVRSKVNEDPDKYGEVDVDGEIGAQVGLPVELIRQIRKTPGQIKVHIAAAVKRDFPTAGSANYMRQLINDAMLREYQDTAD